MTEEGAGKLLSVIIPVYNTEETFLRRCLETFSNEMPDVELIVVDDGSCEDCRRLEKEILATLATASKLILKENGGQNSARQMGIASATGEYLLFLDSDDYLDLPALNKALEILRSSSPAVLAYNVAVVDEQGKELFAYDYFDEDLIDIDKRTLILQSRTLFGQLMRKSLFDNYSLVQGPTIGEDMASVEPILAKAESFRAIPDRLYQYVRRSSSVTHSFSTKSMFDILDSFDGLLERMGEQRDLYSMEIEWLAIRHILFFGAKRVIETVGPSQAAKRKLFAYMDFTFPLWRENSYLRTESGKFGLSFHLLVGGRWRAYAAVRRIRELVSTPLRTARL